MQNLNAQKYVKQPTQNKDQKMKANKKLKLDTNLDNQRIGKIEDDKFQEI